MKLSQLLRRTALVGLVALLAACATPAPPARAPVPVQVPPPQRPVVTPPTPAQEAPPRPRTPVANAALQPLLSKAAQATAAGDFEQAMALLERAQRIDPGSADVYLGMAQTHHARRDIAQARVTAERGLLYCASDAQCAALRAYAR